MYVESFEEAQGFKKGIDVYYSDRFSVNAKTLQQPTLPRQQGDHKKTTQNIYQELFFLSSRMLHICTLGIYLLHYKYGLIRYQVPLANSNHSAHIFVLITKTEWGGVNYR